MEYHRPLLAFEGLCDHREVLRIDQPNILLETIKYSEDGEHYIARLWETFRVSTKLNLGIGETNLIETDKHFASESVILRSDRDT